MKVNVKVSSGGAGAAAEALLVRGPLPERGGAGPGHRGGLRGERGEGRGQQEGGRAPRFKNNKKAEKQRNKEQEKKPKQVDVAKQLRDEMESIQAGWLRIQASTKKDPGSLKSERLRALQGCPTKMRNQPRKKSVLVSRASCGFSPLAEVGAPGGRLHRVHRRLERVHAPPRLRGLEQTLAHRNAS